MSLASIGATSLTPFRISIKRHLLPSNPGVFRSALATTAALTSELCSDSAYQRHGQPSSCPSLPNTAPPQIPSRPSPARFEDSAAYGRPPRGRPAVSLLRPALCDSRDVDSQRLPSYDGFLCIDVSFRRQNRPISPGGRVGQDKRGAGSLPLGRQPVPMAGRPPAGTSSKGNV